MNQNLEFIKEELSAQEKFLESVIKIETFAKKYKKLLIALGVIVIVGITVYGVSEYIKSESLEDSNRAYLTLLSDLNDESAKNILKKKNPNLYSVYLFQKAIKDGDIKALNEIANKNMVVISDLSKYQLATLKKETTALSSYLTLKDAILKDFALFQEAYLLIKEDKLDEAKLKLSMIGLESPTKNVANFLEHYLIKK